jgi:hypothetical protein
MAWAVPLHSKSAVDKAGKILVSGGGDQAVLEAALQVINNWRSSHSFPVNTIQVNLRRHAKQVDQGALVAQRIKRLSSISHKLERFPTMKLSQMQDIGGCRAVVSNVARVEALRNLYCGAILRHRHEFVRVDDYLLNPKASGYRGIHLIYRYQSDRTSAYNGLQVEIQLRSKLQHAWATAVETVSTFLEQALKSSQGSEQWLRFFSLMGSALALREKRPFVPGTPLDPDELRAELRSITLELKVKAKLEGYGNALQTVERGTVGKAFYFLLALDPGADQGATLAVQEYAKAQLEQATADYLRVERSLVGRPGAEAVLVSVESLDALRRAYPNYFLDTGVFLTAVEEAIS